MPPMRPISCRVSVATLCRCPHRPAIAARQTHFPSNWSRAVDRPPNGHRAKSPGHGCSYGSRTPRASPRANLGRTRSTAARSRRKPSRLTGIRPGCSFAHLNRNGRRCFAWNFRGILELLQDLGDSRIQLHIIAGVYGQRVQGHLDIRSNAFILDAPLTLRRKHSKERYAEKSTVDQRGIGGYPDQSAPCARADEFAEAQPPKAVRQKIAAGPCVLID